MTASGDNLLGIHLARMLAEKSALQGGEKTRFGQLITDLVEAINDGHSCLPLDEDDIKIVQQSSLVSLGEPAPLVFFSDKLYFHRYFSYESRLARQISAMAIAEQECCDLNTDLERAFGVGSGEDDLQRAAAEMATRKRLTILSGGPGTGKTTTVVRMLAILIRLHARQDGGSYKIALAAPTGKAAMRLLQSVTDSVASLPFSDKTRNVIPGHANTLHRLLGVQRYSPQFRYNLNNPLPWDVVVVDEASMIDLALMSKLVDAIKPGGRLILLGDKDQLASVESGAVLADLVDSIPENTVVLKKSYRFDAAIKKLAEAVNQNRAAAAWQLLEDSGYPNIRILKMGRQDLLYNGYRQYMAYAGRVSVEEYALVFQQFNRFRVLCAVHSGHLGVDNINDRIETYFSRQNGFSERWYPGKPVIIRKNDYTINLYNGDVGICLLDPSDNMMKIWFEDNNGGVRSFLPYRLPEHQTAFAMTIHKSQGSEFDDVVIILPERESQVVSRELIYTAVTRARKNVWLYGEKEMFFTALSQRTRRFSGLASMIRRQRREVSG